MPVQVGIGHTVMWAIGFALVVGGCASAGDDAGPAAKPAASASTSGTSDRALVKWADHMCAATELFATMKKDSAADVDEITDPPEDALIDPGFAAEGYLGDASSSLDEVARGLADARPSGIAAADRLHDRLSEEVERVRPKVAELADSSEFADPGNSVDHAKRAGRLIKSLTMPEPDLAAVVAGEPRLSAAHGKAPECAPPAPLPKAADGTDLGACADGACEVLVTKQADVVVGAWELRVSPEGTKVVVRNDGPNGPAGETELKTGGAGSFGDADGGEVTVDAVGVDEDGAVLKFSTK